MRDANIALKKIAKGASIVLTGLFVSKALSYVYRLIIARISTEQYGLFSIASAVFSILFVISLLGLNDGVIRFVSYYKGKSDERRIKGTITSALKISLPLSLGLGLALFMLSDWIAITFFHNIKIGILLKIFAFVLPLDVIRNIFFSVIRGFQKVEYEVYSKSIAENVFKVLLTGIAVYLGFGVVSATWAYLIAVFISFVLSMYFLEKKVFPVFFSKIVSIKLYKPLLTYSIPLLFTGFIYLIIQWTDTLMLGFFKTAEEVGIYNVALPTAFLLFVIPSAIRTMFFPMMAELYGKGKKHAFKDIYQVVNKWIIVVETAVFIFLVVFSQQIIRILFGLSYVKDQTTIFGDSFAVSAVALSILALGMITGNATITSKDILLVLKKTRLIFYDTAGAAILNIFLNFLLIPNYGIIGAAISTAVSYTLLDVVIFVQAYFVTRISPIPFKAVLNMFIGLIIFLLMVLFKLYAVTNLVYLFSAMFISLVVYLSLLLIFRIIKKEDFIALMSIKRIVKV